MENDEDPSVAISVNGEGAVEAWPGLSSTFVPRMKSLVLVVETVTLETVPVPDAEAGNPVCGSKGLAVFAPEIPHAIIVSMELPEEVAEISFDDRAELAIA